MRRSARRNETGTGQTDSQRRERQGSVIDCRRAAAMFSVAAAVLLTNDAARAQSSAEEAEPVFTLEQASEAALRHSPQIAQATGAVRNAESAERSAWGQYLPSLSFSTGASRSSTERFNPQTNTTVTGSSDSYSAGLSAQLTLFNGGQRAAGLESARAQLAAADAGLISQRFAVILSVQRTFFEVLRADDLLRVAEARVKRAEESLEAARRRAEVG